MTQAFTIVVEQQSLIALRNLSEKGGSDKERRYDIHCTNIHYKEFITLTFWPLAVCQVNLVPFTSFTVLAQPAFYSYCSAIFAKHL